MSFAVFTNKLETRKKRSIILKKITLLTEMKTFNKSSREDKKILINQILALYPRHLVMISQYFVTQNLQMDAHVNKFKI